MKKWDNGIVILPIQSCMTCPNHKLIYGKMKISGLWVTVTREVICKRTGKGVKLMGISPDCPLPNNEEDGTTASAGTNEGREDDAE